MRNLDLFSQIAHVDVPWGDRTINVPIFYYDMSVIGVAFLTPIARIQPLLPSPRLYPLRVTPWHGMTTITAYEYRDCDLGPYNEVSIGFPVTLDRASPVFTGILRKLQGVPKVYVHHLPVTTEIARDAGVEFANFPKFLADITFESKGGWRRCRLAEARNPILTLAVRELPVQPTERTYIHTLTFREGRILRLELILSERDQAMSRDPAHVRLDLGDHPIAQELRALNLGRMLYCQYAPQCQVILSPVLESF